MDQAVSARDRLIADTIFQLIDQVEDLQVVVAELNDKVSRLAGALELAKKSRVWLAEVGC